jgi:hypothetical protein
MLLANRAFPALTPEDQRIKRKWARCVAGFYAAFAIGLFCLAFAPSSGPQSVATKQSGAPIVAQN